MTTTVIQAEGLSKRYQRGALSAPELLRETLARTLRSPWAAFQRKKPDTFWALKDVSLHVCEGEVMGLVGRNGSGKTTLLKILSRITRPTEGWAEIHGRVGSLLEVGTGFHPELTGRENTFLSGAILGMSKQEITRKFDEIVAFAELEKFIDTPVKHYSSGMFVRLAFAVAAHLEPEILLVDEVLAVGDINFQKKCLGKMGDVAKAGRTVVLVSHQMNQIRRLSHRVVWLDDGQLRMDGVPHQVLAAYESSMSTREHVNRRLTSKARFLHWDIDQESGGDPHLLSTIGPIKINFALELAQPLVKGEHGVALFDSGRQLMWAQARQDLTLRPGVHILSHSFPTLPLRPGSYQWQVSLWDGVEMLDHWDALPEMTIATEINQHYRDEWNGILNLATIFVCRPGE
jgi:ABC-type polysaccharide/polyol phosphate transport system ATPase subunit